MPDNFITRMGQGLQNLGTRLDAATTAFQETAAPTAEKVVAPRPQGPTVREQLGKVFDQPVGTNVSGGQNPTLGSVLWKGPIRAGMFGEPRTVFGKLLHPWGQQSTTGVAQGATMLPTLQFLPASRPGHFSTPSGVQVTRRMGNIPDAQVSGQTDLVLPDQRQVTVFEVGNEGSPNLVATNAADGLNKIPAEVGRNPYSGHPEVRVLNRDGVSTTTVDLATYQISPGDAKAAQTLKSANGWQEAPSAPAVNSFTTGQGIGVRISTGQWKGSQNDLAVYTFGDYVVSVEDRHTAGQPPNTVLTALGPPNMAPLQGHMRYNRETGHREAFFTTPEGNPMAVDLTTHKVGTADRY